MTHQRKNGSALAGILATIAVVMLIFAGLGVTMGWVTWSDSPDKSTIEIDKTEMKADTDKAVEATEKFIKDSAETVEQATEEAAEEVTPDEEPETITPVPEESEPTTTEVEKDKS